MGLTGRILLIIIIHPRSLEVLPNSPTLNVSYLPRAKPEKCQLYVTGTLMEVA